MVAGSGHSSDSYSQISYTYMHDYTIIMGVLLAPTILFLIPFCCFLHFLQEWYPGLESIVECDTPTICDGVDIANVWSEDDLDLSSDTVSNEIKIASSDYILSPGITI